VTNVKENELLESPAASPTDDAGVPRPEKRGEPRKAPRVDTEYSRGLGEWLISNRVAIVSSTYLTGYLLFLGVRADGVVVPSAASFSMAMGLAASSQRIYLGTKNEIWRLENILGPKELANGVFDRFYVPRASGLTGDINIHELGIDARGNVLFANTRYSCLSAVSVTHAFKPLWKPKFISRLAPEDRCHLNGLAMENGRPRYMTACSTGDVLESWRGGRRDGGVVVDLATDAILCEGLSMPHSPRVWGGALYLLESGRGYLVKIDRETGKREDVTFCPGFARGLAFLSDYAVVTVSLPRRGSFEDLPIEQALRSNGTAPRCGLLIIDLRNGDIVQWFRLYGDINELFDVGIIANARCPRGIGPYAPALEEAMRGEAMAQRQQPQNSGPSNNREPNQLAAE
jgi:uncharacterized protein (TIGR03032 family)